MGSERFPGGGAWGTAFATLALGAASLWAQVVVVRGGLVAFGGNELVLAFLFGWWLFAVGTGAVCGGLCARAHSGRIELHLGFVLLLFAGVFYGDFLLARGLRAVVGLPAGQVPTLSQIAAGTALCTCPVSFLVGFSFPLLAASRRRFAVGTGEVYALEALGSLGAAFVGTYLFLAWGREELLVFSGVALLLAAAWFVLPGPVLRRAAAALVATWCILGLVDLRVLIQRGDALRWHGLLKGFRLLEGAETPYGNLTVLGGLGQYQLYLNGRLAFAFPDPVAEEIEAHTAATESPHLKRVVIVGGRPGLVREFAKYHLDELTVVRMDPAVQRLVEPYLDEATRKALKKATYVIEDPRQYVRSRPSGSCDLLVLSLPQPSSAGLNRFYTVEFFREVKRILAPLGVLTFGIQTGVRLEEASSLYAATCLRTLQAVFPDPQLTAVPGIRFYASPTEGVVTTDGEVLARRFAERKVGTERFRDLYFLGSEAFRPAALRFTRGRVEEALSRVAPEEDGRPTLYLRYLRLVAQRTGSSLEKFIAKILSLEPWEVLPFALLPGAAVFIFRRRRTPAVLLAVFTTGGWGMALELVILFAFQIAAGSLYYKVGLVVGAFMCGLAAGAFRGRVSPNARRSLLSAEGTAAGLALLTPGLVGAAGAVGPSAAQILLCLWVGLVGAATGYEFSAANLLLAGSGSERRSWIVAALTDGADHLGASVGAVITGLVVLPSLGVTGASLFLAIAKGGTLIGLWRGGLGPRG